MNENLLLRTRMERNGLSTDDDIVRKLSVYMALLEEWNGKMDLSAVMDPDETIDRHFIDSLAVLKTERLKEGKSLIDVGTGAGFPGMVLAIARPDLSVTLLDAQRKRLDFLAEVIRATGSANVALLHGRAEDAGRNPSLREQFDYAVARAVAPLDVLCEYLLPFVKISGSMLCWKGPALKNEMESGRKAAHLLGGRLEMPIRCQIEGRDWEHTILPVIKVQKTTAGYPRKAGKPKSQPLGKE